MAIKINGKDLAKRIINGQEVQKVMLNGSQIRPNEVPPVDDYLCFTANTSNSRLMFYHVWEPSIYFEISRDGNTWTDYYIDGYWDWDEITLSNVWDRVYFRNKSSTVVDFSYWNFEMRWSIAASWDLNYLLCKNSTTTLTTRECYQGLFAGCTALTTPPKLPATQLTLQCYSEMFNGCTNLVTAPALPATSLAATCYANMFAWCSSLQQLPALPATSIPSIAYNGMFSWCTNIKISETQTWEYQTPYRIPTTWEWTIWTISLSRMFDSTWGTFTGTPSINQIYYTSNTIIS